MTDDDIKQLEHVAIECGHITHDAEWWWENCHPDMVQNLIAELRQVRRERDWLASQLEGACYSAEDAEYCSLHDCNDCKYTSAKVWLEAAKEAVCKN